MKEPRQNKVLKASFGGLDGGISNYKHFFLRNSLERGLLQKMVKRTMKHSTGKKVHLQRQQSITDLVSKVTYYVLTKSLRTKCLVRAISDLRSITNGRTLFKSSSSVCDGYVGWCKRVKYAWDWHLDHRWPAQSHFNMARSSLAKCSTNNFIELALHGMLISL